MDSLSKIAALIRDPDVTIDTQAFVLALVVSLVVSFGLSLLYQIFYEDRATGSQVHRSFILLGPSITALFIAIQYSLPLSLGLLGALSIIRFRTPIKEPEEVGFIMLLCACAVVTATFKFLLILALLVVVTCGLLIRRLIPSLSASSRRDGIVLVSFVNDGDGGELFSRYHRALGETLSKGKMESVTETSGLTTLQYSFCDLSGDGLATLRQKLAGHESLKSVNIYFNRSSSLL
jgi:hypothetical protein